MCIYFPTFFLLIISKNVPNSHCVLFGFLFLLFCSKNKIKQCLAWLLWTVETKSMIPLPVCTSTMHYNENIFPNKRRVTMCSILESPFISYFSGLFLYDFGLSCHFQTTMWYVVCSLWTIYKSNDLFRYVIEEIFTGLMYYFFHIFFYLSLNIGETK